MNKTEMGADSRIITHGQLRWAGWDPTDKPQMGTEVTVQLTRKNAPMNNATRTIFQTAA